MINLTTVSKNRMTDPPSGLCDLSDRDRQLIMTLAVNQDCSHRAAELIARFAQGHNSALMGRFKTLFSQQIEKHLPENCTPVYMDYFYSIDQKQRVKRYA